MWLTVCPGGAARAHEEEEAKVEYKCFVGGISWQMEDPDLSEAFAKFNVVGAQVMKVRPQLRRLVTATACFFTPRANYFRHNLGDFGIIVSPIAPTPEICGQFR